MNIKIKKIKISRAEKAWNDLGEERNFTKITKQVSGHLIEIIKGAFLAGYEAGVNDKD